MQSLSDAELQARIESLKTRAAAASARLSFRSYCRFVLKLEPAPHHDLIIDALQGVATGSITKLCIIAPPGHAKSTYATIAFPSWYLGEHYGDHLIGVSTTDPLATLYHDSIRTIIEENRGWQATFPGVKPDYKRGWSSERAFLQGPKRPIFGSKDPQLTFVGAGGGIIGRRADGMVIDDAVDEPTARSETLLEARKLWIKRSAFSRLRPGGWRVIIGTRWADGDVVDAASQDPTYVVVTMAALASGSLVTADVSIPDGVSWRPGQPYREITDDEHDAVADAG